MAGHVLYSVKTADGKVHASAADAAKHLGVARGTVYYHLHTHGHLGNVGGRHKSDRARFLNRKHSQPLVFVQLKFASKQECSRWLGKNESYVKILLRDYPGQEGLDRLRDKIMARALELDAKRIKEMNIVQKKRSRDHEEG